MDLDAGDHGVVCLGAVDAVLDEVLQIVCDGPLCHLNEQPPSDAVTHSTVGQITETLPSGIATQDAFTSSTAAQSKY